MTNEWKCFTCVEPTEEECIQGIYVTNDITTHWSNIAHTYGPVKSGNWKYWRLAEKKEDECSYLHSREYIKQQAKIGVLEGEVQLLLEKLEALKSRAPKEYKWKKVSDISGLGRSVLFRNFPGAYVQQGHYSGFKGIVDYGGLTIPLDWEYCEIPV